MGNITTKSVGNFQANVGIFSADIGVIISYVTAGILIIVAIGLAIAAFVLMKPWNCDNQQELNDNIKTFCSNGQDKSLTCSNAKDENKRCNTKVKQPQLLWFLLLIPGAILLVFIAKYWDKLVHRNKTAAQIGGTMFELNTLKNLMK